MTQELIISISGMRGLVGQNMFPETAVLYGAAFGTFLREQDKTQNNKPTVAVGRDSRPSGTLFASAVAAGLAAAGIEVIDLGICSTPAVGLMLRHLGCQGGVVITASHNPIEYNGIKLLLDDGIAPPKPLAEQIRRRFLDKRIHYVGSLDCGQVRQNEQTVDLHVQKVLSIVDPGAISEKQYTAVLDSANGAGGAEGRRLLEALGCRVIGMNLEPTGIFAHKPEPIKENLQQLCDKVKETGADIGFAQDPDADRVAIVDKTGRYIGEEYSLAFAAMLRFRRQPGGTAAANLSTSRMIDDIAAGAGGSVIRTPVGEAHVAAAMIENNCLIGGEGNGGVIDLRVGPIRDSLVGMALTLQLMADTGKSVADLVSQIGRYEMVKTKFPADKTRAQAIIERTKALFPEARLDTRDGCRLDMPDGWIHIRTSNTEPIMRVIFETKDPAHADRFQQSLETVCREAANP